MYEYQVQSLRSTAKLGKQYGEESIMKTKTDICSCALILYRHVSQEGHEKPVTWWSWGSGR